MDYGIILGLGMEGTGKAGRLQGKINYEQRTYEFYLGPFQSQGSVLDLVLQLASFIV